MSCCNARGRPCDEWVFVLSAGRKLSSANLFGDSNLAILKQSNNVNNQQGAFFGECDGQKTWSNAVLDYCLSNSFTRLAGGQCLAGTNTVYTVELRRCKRCHRQLPAPLSGLVFSIAKLGQFA